MTDPVRFASLLLQQDESLHTPRYEEHRMQLEQQLVRAEWREMTARRVVITALGIAIAVIPLIATRAFGGIDPWDDDATAVSVSLGVLYWLAVTVFLVGLASYYSRFRPGVREARDRLRDDSIQQLRHELAELRRQLSGDNPGR
jgi:hypothetical protein